MIKMVCNDIAYYYESIEHLRSAVADGMNLSMLQFAGLAIRVSTDEIIKNRYGNMVVADQLLMNSNTKKELS